MPIDFNDLIDTLRSDGKLLISSLVKAATGKKIVTDVAEDTNDVTIELEDDTGTASSVTIPKIDRRRAPRPGAGARAHRGDAGPRR